MRLSLASLVLVGACGTCPAAIHEAGCGEGSAAQSGGGDAADTSVESVRQASDCVGLASADCLECSLVSRTGSTTANHGPWGYWTTITEVDEDATMVRGIVQFMFIDMHSATLEVNEAADIGPRCETGQPPHSPGTLRLSAEFVGNELRASFPCGGNQTIGTLENGRLVVRTAGHTRTFVRLSSALLVPSYVRQEFEECRPIVGE